MSHLDESIRDFLESDGIAVVGVSRDSRQPANAIFRKLRDSGRRVVPVNPKAEELEGARCHPDVASIPDRVEAAVVVTPPAESAGVVRECAGRGIRKVWLHRSFGAGSVSPMAIEAARELGIALIPGGCPMMAVEPVDPGHRCIRWFLKWTGGLPEPTSPA